MRCHPGTTCFVCSVRMHRNAASAPKVQCYLLTNSAIGSLHTWMDTSYGDLTPWLPLTRESGPSAMTGFARICAPEEPNLRLVLAQTCQLARALCIPVLVIDIE